MSEPPRDAMLAYQSARGDRLELAVVLGVVAMRLLGVYFLVEAAASVPAMVYVDRQLNSTFQPTGGARIANLLLLSCQPAILASVGGILFAFAPPLGRRFFRGVHSDGAAASSSQIATLLVAGVGLLTATTALTPLLNELFMLLNFWPASLRGTRTGLPAWPEFAKIISAATQPAAGIVLFLNADRIARVVDRRSGARVDASPRSPDV